MSLPAQNLTQLLHTILNSFMDLCGCDGGTIFTVRKEKEKDPILTFETMITRSIRLSWVPDDLKALSFKFDDTTLVGKTAFRRQLFKISAREHENQISSRVEHILRYKTTTLLSAPLITPRGDLVGVVQLLNKLPVKRKGKSSKLFLLKDFDDRDERLLSAVAAQAALAVENSMLLEEQERLLDGFVKACITAVEARDPITSGHSERVSDYTLRLADAVNRTENGPLKDFLFNDTQLREIRYAAMLHDIGKISVREAVLHKERKLQEWELEVIRIRLRLMRTSLRLLEGTRDPDLCEKIEKLKFAWNFISEANEPTVLPAEINKVVEELQNMIVRLEDGEMMQALTFDERIKLSIPKGSLTETERLEIEKHVTNTYEILKMVPWSKGLENVPLYAFRHHEKLDGTGYPCRATSEEIPIQSRMLTICDIYDALRADDRPYKRAVPIEKALEILKMEVTGAKLDHDLFQVFLDARIFETTRIFDKKKKAA